MQLHGLQIFSPILSVASSLCCVFSFAVHKLLGGYISLGPNSLFVFIAYASDVFFKKSLPMQMSCKVSLMLSPSNFMIANCRFISLNRLRISVLFCLGFSYEVWGQGSVYSDVICPVKLAEDTVLSLVTDFRSFIKDY